jgi:hypothetical protein
MRQLQTMCAQKHLDWILILETDRMPGGARGKEVPTCVKKKMLKQTYCYICVLVLLLLFFRTAVCRGARGAELLVCVSTYYYICVLLLLLHLLLYMCPHAKGAD